jgi:2-oxoisovalerate dehydrogenase E2 component (dihydrolipoyl transacylase)
MPQLGESVTEGTIARWLKQPGDPVARYESIVEVASDKVNAEIPAPVAGTFGEIIAAEGSVVSVGQPICTIEQGSVASADAAPAAAPAPPVEAPPPPPEAPPSPASAAPPVTTERPAAEAPGQGPVAAPEWAATERPVAAVQPPVAAAVTGADGAAAQPGNQHVTPVVRMLAREHGVDLGEIQGTGLGGRVTKKDVLEHVQRRDAAGPVAAPLSAPAAAPTAAPAHVPAAAPASLPAAPSAAFPAPSAAAEEGDQLLPMTSIRRAIADHMVRSRQTSPHAWLMVEVDMSRVVRLREARKAAFRERYGISLTYLPFVARAVVEALRRWPTLNAQWSEAGVVLKRDINLGIAVALEENLVVPVLRHADRLSVAGLAQAMADLGERARANRLKLDEIQGGTFTLNNTGALGTVMTQAIINQPQAAILTMDAVIKRPVVVDDMIAIRPIMNLGMSFDHRINDGLQAARFIQDVKGQLEGLDEGATLL